ncbi:MAG: universal stress protein [Nitrospiraceae bacterium]|nr:MAG: universal stress protein [Nitrospiraceae bacterium]
MKKILIAIDETKGSRAALSAFSNEIRQAGEVVLLHVERLEGKSLMTAMLGDAELSTLKEALKGSEHKEALDIKAEGILASCKKGIEAGGQTNIKIMVRDGNPVDEILKVADEESAEAIILGESRKTFLSRLFTGSVSRDVEKAAKVPVLIPRIFPSCEAPYNWKDAYLAFVVFTIVFLGLFLLGLVARDGTFFH